MTVVVLNLNMFDHHLFAHKHKARLTLDYNHMFTATT